MASATNITQTLSQDTTTYDGDEDTRAKSLDNVSLLESETEDEEVKLNCVGGLRGIDTTNDESSSFDDDDLEEDDDEDVSFEGPGVVHFSGDCVCNTAVTTHLVHPQPTTPPRLMLSPFRDDDDESDISEVEEGGARGVALSIGRSSAMSDESEEESTSSDEDYIWDVLKTESSIDDSAYHAEEEDFDCDGIHFDDSDDELFNIVESFEVNFHEAFHSEAAMTEGLLGVSEDRHDLITVPMTKRVHSSNSLISANIETRHIDDRSKRLKTSWTVDNSSTLGFSGFSSEGIKAFVNVTQFCRRESPIISSSDDEELDRRLEDELGAHQDYDRESTPVPLLTPPESPVTVEIDGNKTTVCEWPSNLAVDNAIFAVLSDIQPLVFEPSQYFAQELDEQFNKFGTSTLSPLLRSISVGQ